MESRFIVHVSKAGAIGLHYSRLVLNLVPYYLVDLILKTRLISIRRMNLATLHFAIMKISISIVILNIKMESYNDI